MRGVRTCLQTCAVAIRPYGIQIMCVMHNVCNSAVCGNKGVSEDPKWTHFGGISARYTIPIRARAYNDCVKHTVLPKTRSSGGPGYPPH